MKKFIILLFGIISYVIFFATFLYAIGFVGNIYVPYSIDRGGTTTDYALWVNLGLMSVFAIQHSVMARPAFKRWITKFIDPAAERSLYVLLSSAALILLFWQWQPMTERVWNIEGALYMKIIEIGFWGGWAVVLISTFLINHFHLFGLQQVFQRFKEQTLSHPKFSKNLFYKLVRHPIITGFLAAFWAEDTMTYGGFLFAAVVTIYSFIAVKFLEERDLVSIHGDTYKEYQKSTPMLIPFTKFRKKK
jgi:protein-S-isoprenylcysteine O-methyltransferase Ste14